MIIFLAVLRMLFRNKYYKKITKNITIKTTRDNRDHICNNALHQLEIYLH